jgi:hypothetical protein
MANYKKRRDFWNRKREKTIIKHKFSLDEYKKMRKELMGELKEIEQNLSPFIESKLKEKMIKIHLQNLLNAVKHYFTPKAQRISVNINTKYKNGAAEIFKFTRYLDKKKDIEGAQQKIYKNLQDVIQKIDAQITYIKEIEEKRHEKRQKKINAQNIY